MSDSYDDDDGDDRPDPFPSAARILTPIVLEEDAHAGMEISDQQRREMLRRLRLLPPEALREIRARAIAAHGERLSSSLAEYVREAWSICEPETPYVHGWHIEAIADHLEACSRGDIRSLVITVPPRHMKSYLVSVFWMTWEWTRRPWLRWIFASHSEGFATRDSLKCRRIFESRWYRERWGGIVQMASDQNNKTRFENTRTGVRIAVGTGTSIAGEGGDRIVVDDANDPDPRKFSDDVREATLTWWDQALSTRYSDPRTVVRVIIGQRLHERDLPGHILARSQGEWTHLCLPMEHESPAQIEVTNIGWRDPRDRADEVLWPERFGPIEIADTKRTMGSYAYAAQFQQRPVPAGGGVFKREWWRYYSLAPNEMAKSLESVVQSWDCTFKDVAGSDYVVGIVGGRRGADIYILDLIRDRMDFPATCRAIESFTAKWPLATTKLIEDKANGPAVIAQLRSRIGGLVPVEPRGSKEARAASVSPYVEAGNVYLPADAEWTEGFIAELGSFPRGAHDDRVDSFSQLLDRLTTNVSFNLAAYVDMEIQRTNEALGITTTTKPPGNGNGAPAV